MLSEDINIGNPGINRSNARREDGLNLYDLLKVIANRRKIATAIFIVPLLIVTIVSLSLPRYYRGESELSNPIISAANMVRLIENIDDTQKAKIFRNNTDSIKKVSASLSIRSTDKIRIIVDTKTADIIPQALKDIYDYISELPEVNDHITKINKEIDLKKERLIEAKKANLIFLTQITDMMNKKKQVLFNPADLIKKDTDLTEEITNLQNKKATVGILGPPSITKQPSNAQIINIILITVILSLMVCVCVVFFLDYIDRMKITKINKDDLQDPPTRTA